MSFGPGLCSPLHRCRRLHRPALFSPSNLSSLLMLSQEYAGPLFNSVRVTGQLVPLDGADSSQIAL